MCGGVGVVLLRDFIMNDDGFTGPIPTRYCPIFETLLDSSLWSEPYHVRLVFIAMLALKDMNDVVHLNAYNIATRARMTEKEVLEALEILSSPDKERIEPQPYEGRRIEKVDGGWLILNGRHYRRMVTRINILATKAQWARKNRAKKSGKNRMLNMNGSGSLTGETAELRGVPIKGLEEEIAEVKQAKKGNDPVIAEPVKSPFETPYVPKPHDHVSRFV